MRGDTCTLLQQAAGRSRVRYTKYDQGMLGCDPRVKPIYRKWCQHELEKQAAPPTSDSFLVIRKATPGYREHLQLRVRTTSIADNMSVCTRRVLWDNGAFHNYRLRDRKRRMVISGENFIEGNSYSTRTRKLLNKPSLSLLESYWILRLMDYLPELAHNGQNWTAYGSSVLCAINDEGLMGFLVGSERRPTHPAELEGRGEGWTPQTDEERDEVAVWRTAEQSWTRRNATVNYTIICGIPDTIFSSMLHLKSPLEKWYYLENRFGRIPRPESWLAAEEAMRQSNLPFERDTAGESSQEVGERNDEPKISPGSHEDPVDSLNDCTETESGYLTPETEVAERKNMEPNPPVVEVGGADLELSDEHANMVEAPDEGSWCASDEVEESQDLPGLSSKALEPAGDTTRPPGSRSIESGPLPSFEEDQSTRTHSDEPILDIPDPPGTHIELSVPRVKSPTLQNDPEVTGSTLGDPSKESERSSQLRETERPEPHRDRTSKGKFHIDEGRYTSDTPPNKVWGMGVPRTPRVGLGDSADIESKMTKLEIRGISAKTAGMENAIPTPLEPPPIGLEHTPTPFSDPPRRGRLKTRAENVSNMRARRNACHARVVFVRPLLPLLAPSNRSLDPTRGLLTTNIGCREVRHARRVETRGNTYRAARILMQLPLPLSTPLKWSGDPAGGSWMISVRCNDVRRARKVETRGDTHQTAGIPMPLLQLLPNPSKRLWNISNTYWRQGVPPRSIRDDAKWPTNRRRAKRLPRSSGTGQRTAHRKSTPEMEVATMRRVKHDQTSLVHGLEAH
ncbi:hypothetical protein EDD15DRAFT_2518798 [Pisolithus albus]|nr:hypothetical protein EDD15DRAFT_2518798 [Pisolithus albus]